MLIEHNSFTDYHNKNLDFIAESIEQFNTVSEELYKLIEDTKKANKDYDDKLNELLINFYKLETSTSDKIDEIKNQVVNYTGLIKSQVDQLDEKIETQNKHINEVLESIGENILLYNPFVGYETSLQDIINSMVALNKNDTLTIGELDKLNLTVQAFDDLNITFYDMDWKNKHILEKYL